MCTSVCMCMWRPDVDVECFLSHPLLCFNIVSHSKWSSSIWVGLGQWVPETQLSPPLTSCLGLQMHCAAPRLFKCECWDLYSVPPASVESRLPTELSPQLLKIYIFMSIVPLKKMWNDSHIGFGINFRTNSLSLQESHLLTTVQQTFLFQAD